MSKSEGRGNRNGFLGEAYVSGLKWEKSDGSFYLNSLPQIGEFFLPSPVFQIRLIIIQI